MFFVSPCYYVQCRHSSFTCFVPVSTCLTVKTKKFGVLQQRIPSQKIDSEGPYRLLYCSSKGDKSGVIQELDKGVEPNLGDYDKRTALHLASCEGHTEVISLLLGKGADVNSTDRWGRTVSSYLFLIVGYDNIWK